MTLPLSGDSQYLLVLSTSSACKFTSASAVVALRSVLVRDFLAYPSQARRHWSALLYVTSSAATQCLSFITLFRGAPHRAQLAIVAIGGTLFFKDKEHITVDKAELYTLHQVKQRQESILITSSTWLGGYLKGTVGIFPFSRIRDTQAFL